MDKRFIDEELAAVLKAERDLCADLVEQKCRSWSEHEIGTQLAQLIRAQE